MKTSLTIALVIWGLAIFLEFMITAKLNFMSVGFFTFIFCTLTINC